MFKVQKLMLNGLMWPVVIFDDIIIVNPGTGQTLIGMVILHLVSVSDKAIC